MYLYLANNDYGRVERDLNLFVAPFVFGRDLRANEISYLNWDAYGLQLGEKNEDTIWTSYHTLKCAEYFPTRAFLIVDRFTWSFWEKPAPNMILMDQPNWPNILSNALEIR
jgi:hypothetical protein